MDENRIYTMCFLRDLDRGLVDDKAVLELPVRVLPISRFFPLLFWSKKNALYKQGVSIVNIKSSILRFTTNGRQLKLVNYLTSSTEL